MVMGILGKLFGSDKVIDAGISGIDKAFYTEEERAEDKLKAAPWKIALLKAYEPFKIAQRLLAITFSVPYVSAWCVTFGMSCFDMDVSTQEELLQGDIAKIVWTIIAFYFLGGFAESMGRAKR
jgi:hypothetical protein